jgi:hypothetical protein
VFELVIAVYIIASFSASLSKDQLSAIMVSSWRNLSIHFSSLVSELTPYKTIINFFLCDLYVFAQ